MQKEATYKVLDYAPFGSAMPSRSFTGTSGYRFGFNGMLKESDIAEGNYTTPFRELDTRLGGRWWSQDPIVKPWESPYAGFANNPIFFSDPSGLNPDASNDTDDDYFIDDEGNRVEVSVPAIEIIGKKDPTKSSSEKFQATKEETGRFNTHTHREGFVGKHSASVDYDWFGTDIAYTQFGGETNFNRSFIQKTHTGSDGSFLLNLSVSGVSNQVDAGLRLGHKQLLNLHTQGTGRYLVLESGINLGFASGEQGHYGLKTGGEAGAYIFNGDITFGGTVLGITVDGTLGGSLGSAHIGGKINAYWDNNNGTIEVQGMEHIGLGVGEKIGVNISIGVRSWYNNTVGYVIDLFK